MSTTRNITADEKRAMQQKLTELGLYNDVIDGRWGANSIQAMKEWQWAASYPVQDGIPTYEQMVLLGATVPEVLPAPKRSGKAGGSLLMKLLLNVLPMLLPKVNLNVNNPIILALGRINKAWVAAAVSFVSTYVLLQFFGFELSADTQSFIVMAATSIITGLASWLIPNAAPAPATALGILQTSLARATPDEVVEYNAALWPQNATSAGSYPVVHQPDAPADEVSYMTQTNTGGGDAPRTGQ